jgi:hypothetical protein
MDEDVDGTSMTEKPFTEKDFEKYFYELFPEPFITTLMKVKSNQLAAAGEYRTADIVRNNITYQMIPSVEKRDSSLRLSLCSQMQVDEENVSEFSASYIFQIIGNRKLRFIGIRMAG